MSKQLAFSVSISASATLTIPQEEWDEGIDLIAGYMRAIHEDTDGALFGQVVSGKHEGLLEQGYHAFSGILNAHEGDINEAAEAALLSSFKKNFKESVEENLTDESLKKVQAVVKVTPKSNTITTKKKEAI